MAESLAGLARVAYEAVGLSEFRADNDAAERSYRESTHGMSDAAIKLELSQERLRRSLAKGPAASRESARALLAVRQAERELASQSDRTTRELAQQERQLGRLTRGAVAGSGIFHGLGRSIAFASSGFLGGAGLVYALRSTINAGREAEASQGRVAVAVKNAGVEYGRYRQQIDQTIAKQSQLSAFDDEDLADSFARLVIRTKNVSEALRLNGLAADVARGRNMSLEAATQLVIKASLNQAGQLRRVGIEVGKNTTAQELLNKLTAAYSGQAERYGREGAGAQERLRVAIENTQESLARGLLPTVTNLSNRLADWLNDSRNQERIQKDLNEAVKTGTAVVRGLAGGLRAVKAVAEPVAEALGGIENATKLLVGAALLRRLGLLRLGIAGVGTAAAVSTGEIAAMGTAASTSAASVGRLAMLARGLNVATVAGFAAVIGAQALHARFDEPNTITAAQLRDPKVRARIRDAIGADGLAKLDAASRSQGLVNRPDEGTRGAITNRPRTTPRAGGNRGTGGGGNGLSRFQTLTLASQRAELTAGLSDDLAAAKAIEAYYAGIASNEKLKGDKLFQARQDLLQAQQRTKGIEGQIAADRKSAEDEAAAKRKEAHDKLVAKRKAEDEREAARVKAETDRINAFAAKNTDRINDALRKAKTGRQLIAEGKKARAAATSGDDKPLTAADVRRMQTEFLTSLHGITNQFGSNVSPDQTAVNTWQTARLTEKLVGSVDRLTRGVAHPGAKYARIELMEPYGSVGSV